ncbi:MAG TPA: hypothetical protein VFW73_02765 [Lacipirellulaceae bacterium]|nr:hypothetical protein [Lacipirellulaceae bacterium]
MYQALIGAWPGQIDDDFVKRAQSYALKAAREGKQETSWTSPDENYERALQDFIAGVLDPVRSAEFLTSFAEFSARTSLLGALSGLSQLALKALLPGVPDFFQGTEFWDLSFVDPDNRRPVDFDARQRELNRMPSDWAELASNWRDGRIKLALTGRLLDLRARFPELLRRGSYECLTCKGTHSDHVIAFSRTLKRQQIVVAIGRHLGPLTTGGRTWPKGWDAVLPTPLKASYEDLLQVIPAKRIRELNCAELFHPFPISALRRV